MIIIKNLHNEKPSKPWDVKVDRSSILGNHSPMRYESDRPKVCKKYYIQFHSRLTHKPEQKRFKAELKRMYDIYQQYGKLNLFCHCAPKQCHAETIKDYLEALII